MWFEFYQQCTQLGWWSGKFSLNKVVIIIDDTYNLLYITIHIIEIELKQYLHQLLTIYQILADLNFFKRHPFLMFQQCCCCLRHQCNLWESLSSNLAAQNSLEVPPTTREKSEKKKIDHLLYQTGTKSQLGRSFKKCKYENGIRIMIMKLASWWDNDTTFQPAAAM